MSPVTSSKLPHEQQVVIFYTLAYSKVLGFGAFFQFVLVPVVEGILLKFK